MKLKGINVIEQYVDKIVLAVVAVVLLAVLAMQFLLQPNRITVGSAEGIPPQNAYDPVESEAVRVLAALRNPEPTLPEVEEQTLAGAFDEQMRAQLAPSKRIASLGRAVDPGGSTQGAGISETRIAMPVLPAPTDVVPGAYRGTVSPTEWVLNEDLRPLLPAQQPFDLSVVTVQAKLNGGEVFQALLNDPDGDAGPLSGLPVSWWNRTFEILGAEVERQTLLADGTWSEPELVGPMPGGLNFAQEIREAHDARAADPDVSTLVGYVDLAARQAYDVLQPRFYNTIAGPEWLPPVDALAALAPDSDQEEADRLLRNIEGWNARIEKIVASEQERQGRQNTTRSQSPGGRGGPGGRRPPENTRGTADTQNDAQAQRAQNQIANYEEQIEKAYDKLFELGFDEDGNRVEAADSSATAVGPVLQSDEFTFWVHDIAPPDNATLRYRIRPLFNNPAYGRGLALGEDQLELAADPILPGPWSDWSRQVDTLGSEYYFVRTARESSALGGGPQAAIEMYRFYYGYYRQASMTAEPGDLLVEDVSVPEGLLVYDMEKLQEQIDGGGGSTNAPDLRMRAPSLQPDPRSPDVRSPNVRSPNVLTPDDPRVPDRDRRGPQTIDRQRPATETRPSVRRSTTGEEGEELGEPAPTSVPVHLGVMLLDVSRIPGGGERNLADQIRDRYQALFRDDSGQLVLRIPDDDQASLVYRQVVASAREGKDQLKPDEPEPQPERRMIEPERGPAPIRDEGGGGGGAGGG